MSVESLHAAAEELAAVLRTTKQRIVFAESCTGGLVAATLVGVPGISDHLCGSAVVYRYDTKTRWLGVPAEALIDPGPVSAIVAESMAKGVLDLTPEADLALSITGDLGPNAPPTTDGVVHIGWASSDSAEVGSVRVQLTASDRPSRQREAARHVLERARKVAGR